MPGRRDSFQDSRDVTAETAQFFGHGKRKVFVGIKPEHAASVRFVLRDGTFDFLTVSAVIRPRISEGFGIGKRWHGQKLRQKGLSVTLHE